jgi:hypothetical protein
MVIEQTVEIPENRWLHVEVPSEIPVGVTAKVAITVPEAVSPLFFGHRLSPREAVEKCWGIAQDSGLSSDKFLEMKRKEKILEAEKNQRLFHKTGDKD